MTDLLIFLAGLASGLLALYVSRHVRSGIRKIQGSLDEKEEDNGSPVLTRTQDRLTPHSPVRYDALDVEVEELRREGDVINAARKAAATRPELASRLYEEAGELPAAGKTLVDAGLLDKALALYMRHGNIQHLTRLASERIDDPELLRKAGEYLRSRGSLDGASAVLVKGGHHRLAGAVLEQQGRAKEALAMYEENGVLEDAARLYAAQGENRRAAYLLLKAGEMSAAVDQLIEAGDQLSAARVLAKMGNLARAVEVLGTVSPDADEYRDALLLTASIWEQNQRFPEAAQALEELVRHLGFSDDSAEYVYRLADLQVHACDVQGAVSTLEAAKVAGINGAAIDEHLMALKQTQSCQMVEPPPIAIQYPESGRPLLVKGQGPITTPIGFPRNDRYVLRRKLARGGHGVIYLVHDKARSQDVALKLLNSESLPSKTARDYFLREARTMASLNHPNIVRVFESGELGNRLYIAMEFIDGPNLLQLMELSPQPLSLQRKVNLCLQACAGLAHAHGHRVIHRDIKLENIMVDSHWSVKLLDFGLAKALDENPFQSLFIMGTPNYMSPEQLKGLFLDERTDIYSFGVVMYRLLTGRLPYAETEYASISSLPDPEDPRILVPEIPATLARTVLSCLKADPAERPQTANDLAVALRNTLLEL